MSDDDLGDRLTQSNIERQLKRMHNAKYPFIIYKEPNLDMDDVPVFRAYAPETNIDILTVAAASSGFFSLRSDSDGVVRWMPLVIQGGEDFFPPLFEALALWHQDGPSRIMAERCQLFKKTPPPEDWDGVFEALHK